MANINNFTSLDIKDYSDYDFVDFNIVSESNKEYGRVSRVLGSKITSLLEVSYLEKSYLIPINEAFIITVNKKEKSIVVKNIEEISSLWYSTFLVFLEKLLSQASNMEFYPRELKIIK